MPATADTGTGDGSCCWESVLGARFRVGRLRRTPLGVRFRGGSKSSLVGRGDAGAGGASGPGGCRLARLESTRGSSAVGTSGMAASVLVGSSSHGVVIGHLTFAPGSEAMDPTWARTGDNDEDLCAIVARLTALLREKYPGELSGLRPGLRRMSVGDPKGLSTMLPPSSSCCCSSMAASAPLPGLVGAAAK